MSSDATSFVSDFLEVESRLQAAASIRSEMVSKILDHFNIWVEAVRQCSSGFYSDRQADVVRSLENLPDVESFISFIRYVPSLKYFEVSVVAREDLNTLSLWVRYESFHYDVYFVIPADVAACILSFDNELIKNHAKDFYKSWSEKIAAANALSKNEEIKRVEKQIESMQRQIERLRNG